MGRKEKDAERMERKQQKTDSGLMSVRYPDVSSINIYMNYYQRNADLSFMQSTVNFYPGSAAYFLLECMRKDCLAGGFNFEPVITNMTKDRLESGNGELFCHGNNSLGHVRVDYKIAIQYNK